MKKRPILSLLASATLGAGALHTHAQPPVTRMIPGQYIVTLQSDADPTTIAAEVGMQPKHLFKHALKGFAGALSDAQVDRLQRDPRVQWVEPDEIVQALPTTEAAVQPVGSWGLDRIDQRDRALDGVYSYERTGAGVTVYVIDSGIRYSHTEFSGRARPGFDLFGGNGSDCRGHGTWVAGIIGGLTHGVAKDVELVSVRVLDCNGSGTASGVLAGVEWVTANHVKPAVANMSLTAGASALLAGVRTMIEAGVPTAVAAGNGDDNSCDWLLTTVEGSMATGGTNSEDMRGVSSFGACIDWFAPGVNIPAAGHLTDVEVVTKSGTSGATAFTSARAALFLEGNPMARPDQVRDALYDFTTKHVVKLAGTEHNHLLYSFDEVGLAPTDVDITPPTVAITSPIDGASVPRRSRLTVQASAADEIGVLEVQFYVNGVLTCTDQTAPYECSFTTDSRPRTYYRVSARAIDAALNLSVATISVTTK